MKLVGNQNEEKQGERIAKYLRRLIRNPMLSGEEEEEEEEEEDDDEEGEKHVISPNCNLSLPYLHFIKYL